MKIFCVQCDQDVIARRTTGEEIYPHSTHLHSLPFWRCDTCGNYVGCNYKSHRPTKPLGSIPTPELRKLRQRIHNRLDPLWRSGRISRAALYARLSAQLGYTYHTALVNSHKEANRVWQLLGKIELSLLRREKSDRDKRNKQRGNDE